jgi:hypothetical protein
MTQGTECVSDARFASHSLHRGTDSRHNATVVAAIALSGHNIHISTIQSSCRTSREILFSIQKLFNEVSAVYSVHHKVAAGILRRKTQLLNAEASGTQLPLCCTHFDTSLLVLFQKNGHSCRREVYP